MPDDVVLRTNTLTKRFGDPTAVDGPLPDQGQAALVLAIYTIVFVALAFWRLRTRDVALG